MAAVLLLPTPFFAISGLAVAGLGNSNLVPILLSAAGRDPVLGPGPGIAVVTTLGFCGFLIGPAVIGLMSKSFGLPVALSLVATADHNRREKTRLCELNQVADRSFLSLNTSHLLAAALKAGPLFADGGNVTLSK